MLTQRPLGADRNTVAHAPVHFAATSGFRWDRFFRTTSLESPV